jgi:hypothetical protein
VQGLGLCLHNLVSEGILHIVTFITLCEAFLGIKPHFALWKWVFWVVSLVLGGTFHAMRGARIQVRPNAAGRYLALGHTPRFDPKRCWLRGWFYLPILVPVLVERHARNGDDGDNA